ncbi:hypothetical protein SEA_MARGARET_67 [Gordonia phage Margaret]|nr:hypothetical protein SEA_MARGARET_67 [Gordonia phage Margaret]
MSYRLTLKDIEDQVRALVQEFGEDYKYEALKVASMPEQERQSKGACRYVQWRDPVAQVGFCGCIFGWALNRLGVPVSSLLEVEGVGITQAIHHLGLVDPSDLDWDLDGAWAWGGDVQGAQDGHMSWGDAVRYADRLRTGRRNRALSNGKI